MSSLRMIVTEGFHLPADTEGVQGLESTLRDQLPAFMVESLLAYEGVCHGQKE